MKIIKAILIPFLLLFSYNLHSQIEVLSIDNNTVNNCDGSISLNNDEQNEEFVLQGPSQDINFQFTESILTIDDLCNGDFTISYFDELGCEIKIEFTIESYLQNSFIASIKNTCFGDNSGSIELELPNDGNSSK